MMAVQSCMACTLAVCPAAASATASATPVLAYITQNFTETLSVSSSPPPFTNMLQLLQEDTGYIALNIASSQEHQHQHQQRAFKSQKTRRKIHTNRHNRSHHSIHQPGRTNCSQRFQQK